MPFAEDVLLFLKLGSLVSDSRGRGLGFVSAASAFKESFAVLVDPFVEVAFAFDGFPAHGLLRCLHKLTGLGVGL